MNYNDFFDPELRNRATSFPFSRQIVVVGNIYQELMWRRTNAPKGVVEDSIKTEGSQKLPLKTSIFSPADAGRNMPALIYVHGGGFAYKPAVYHKKLAFIYAKNAGCKVFFPHYHLAPKYRYPTAYEDVLSLYRYVTSHSDELGVDPERVGLAGDSAGGSIAALVCNRWEEEKLIRPCLQMLVYPLTDAGMETDSMKRFTDTPQWNSSYMERMWSYYCGDDKEKRQKATPMQCTLPRVIPTTYIETAEYDCLHDEGILYGEKLREAGADVEINDTKGTFHGYDIALDAQIVKRNVKRRLAFLRNGFNNLETEIK